MKHKFKGTKIQITEEFKKAWKDIPDDKVIQLNISDLRTLEQNSLLHVMIRELADNEGMIPDKLKNMFKTSLLLYDDHVIESSDVSYISRVFHKTSDMGVKELADLILKFEVWALDNYGYTFNPNLKK